MEGVEEGFDGGEEVAVTRIKEPRKKLTEPMKTTASTSKYSRKVQLGME